MLTQQWQQIQVRQLSDAKRKLEIPTIDDAIRVWFSQTANKQIISTVAETSMFGTGEGTRTFTANTLKVGRSIQVKLRGTHTMDPTPPTFTFRVKLGGTTLASVVYTDLNDTNRFFDLDFIFTCRSVGATGSVIGQGRIIMAELSDTVDIYELLMAAPASIDTTAALELDVTAQPSISDANSHITITNGYVEVIY